MQGSTFPRFKASQIYQTFLQATQGWMAEGNSLRIRAPPVEAPVNVSIPRNPVSRVPLVVDGVVRDRRRELDLKSALQAQPVALDAADREDRGGLMIHSAILEGSQEGRADFDMPMSMTGAAGYSSLWRDEGSMTGKGIVSMSHDVSIGVFSRGREPTRLGAGASHAASAGGGGAGAGGGGADRSTLHPLGAVSPSNRKRSFRTDNELPNTLHSRKSDREASRRSDADD